MSEFMLPPGFEDVWRPAASPRVFTPDLPINWRSAEAKAKARLSRMVSGAPEVVVRVTGVARTGQALRSHLDYISRRGDLPLEGPDHEALTGRAQVRELADDWVWGSVVDSGARERSPISRSMVFSMPAGTDSARLMDAVRGFASWEFGGTFDYALVLHTDTEHPHVHAAVRAMGKDGERLNPGKADLDRWRQDFAQDLRVRGIEAEALPRRARGVILKPERMALRQIRQRYEAGDGPEAHVMVEAELEAATTILKANGATPPWEMKINARQEMIREYYSLTAELFAESTEPADQRLARQIDDFLDSMPKALTRHQQREDEYVAARFDGWIPITRGRDRERSR